MNCEKLSLFCVVSLFLLVSTSWATEGIPQTDLPQVELRIGSAVATVQVADENTERQKGLMYHRELGENQGMLFVFARPQPVSFYMRNTFVPLSIAYINATGMILEIHDLTPLEETPVRSRFPTIQFALEMPQGWFTRNRILPGDRIQGLQGLRARD